ncbi:MAG: hypothetical protein ACXVEF_26840 [Polyangiales bacterium]
MTRRSIAVPVAIGVIATVASFAIASRMFTDPYRPTQIGRFLPLVVCLWIAFSSSVQAIGSRVGRGSIPPIMVLLVALVGAPVGCFAAVQTFQMAQEHAVRRVAEQLDPLVQRLLDPSASPLDAIPANPPPGLLVLRSGVEFVVEVDGGSIDIDGSTILYDSKRRRWEQLHHDEKRWKVFRDSVERWSQVYPVVPPANAVTE